MPPTTAVTAVRHVPAAALVPGDRVLPRVAWSGTGRYVVEVQRRSRSVLAKFSPVAGSPSTATWHPAADVPIAERVPTHVLTTGPRAGTPIRWVNSVAFTLDGERLGAIAAGYAPHPAKLLGDVIPGVRLESHDRYTAAAMWNGAMVTVEHEGSGTYVAVVWDLDADRRDEIGGPPEQLTADALRARLRSALESLRVVDQ